MKRFFIQLACVVNWLSILPNPVINELQPAFCIPVHIPMSQSSWAKAHYLDFLRVSGTTSVSRTLRIVRV